MKLLCTLNNFTFVGGGDYSVFKFAQHLSKRGHDVQIFTTTRNAYTVSMEGQENPRIFYRGFFPNLFKGYRAINRMWDRVYSRLVIEPYIQSHPDVDFIIGYHTASAIKAIRLARKFDKPSAIFVFETPVWMAREIGARWIADYKGGFKRLWEQTKAALAKADVIIPNSRRCKIENEKWLQKDIEEPVYPGLDPTSYEGLQTCEKKNQIIYIGRLHIHKNVDLIIRALVRLKNPPQLVLCGEGDDRSRLEKIAREVSVNVEFKGSVSEEEKWRQIGKSLFMVFPTSFEGFGMPPMEALASGIPCICTKIPILEEIYQDKVEYFARGNVEQLAKKIDFLAQNPQYRNERGLAGREYVKKMYRWDRSAQQIEEILSRHLHGKSSSPNTRAASTTGWRKTA